MVRDNNNMYQENRVQSADTTFSSVLRSQQIPREIYSIYKQEIIVIK